MVAAQLLLASGTAAREADRSVKLVYRCAVLAPQPLVVRRSACVMYISGGLALVNIMIALYIPCGMIYACDQRPQKSDLCLCSLSFSVGGYSFDVRLAMSILQGVGVMGTK